MTDRFDLETRMHRAWAIVDDLRDMADNYAESEEIHRNLLLLADYYEDKFQKFQDTLLDYTHSQKVSGTDWFCPGSGDKIESISIYRE